MSLDQHIYGSTDWHLPSPSSTPKLVTFPDTSLKTPKTEVFPQSHFLDAWSTPRVHEQHTPIQTPSLTLSTPRDRPSSSYSQPIRTPQDPEFHVNHFAPQNLPLPPVEIARRLSSSPDPNQVRRTGLGAPDSELGRSRPVGMDFSQMHTPPPTRDATSRRSVQQSAGPGFATPATVIQRTPSHMPTSEALFHQTPFGYASIPFSPDMMPFHNVGPMSAPPMPHSRLFWDQPNDTSQMQMDIDLPLISDPFGPTPHKTEQDIDWQAFDTPVADQMNSQSFQTLHSISSPGPVASFTPSHMGGGQSSRPGSFATMPSGIDPSMLFSFSNTGVSSSFGSMPQQTLKSTYSRQPYETQTRDSLREKEMSKRARSQHSRTNTNSSSDSAENVRPGLQRSNTDSGFRRSRPSSMESRTSNQAASTIPRRSSPLKRQSGGSLTSIPEIRRPRTRLIIDETGRARTETVLADDDETPKVVRKTSQNNLRRQYPGLWEEDDSGSEEGEPAPTISRNTSFNIPQPQRLRASKHARSESGGLERSHSFKMPRPASRPPLDAVDKASFETVRPVRKPAVDASRRFSMMDFPTSFESFKESEDHHMPDSPGDAQGALKRVVAGRQQRIERASQNTLKAHNQRWAQASADIINTTTPHGHGQYDPFSNSFNDSPNTDGLTTPSTDRSSLSSESTRCVCNGIDDGQLMVQCESCTKWLHLGCVGLNAGNLPPVYVCIFCTGQTPIARGGRVRGPIPFDSPLTHKSMFRR